MGGHPTHHSPHRPAYVALCLFGSFPTSRCPRFQTANDEEGEKESGFSPLFMAAMSGNVEVTRALVTEHKADVRCQLREANPITGFEAGGSPMHACMAFDPHGNGDVRALLLNLGADLNAASNSGS